MSTEILAPLGPLLGPNVIMVNVNDDTGRLYQLEVYPDANNPQLQAAGVATHFYFMPKQVYLAKKATAPADFDFGMTVFKGLATTESTIGVTDAMASDGTVEGGGGFCEFSTTFAIPENVIQKAIQQLKAQVGPNAPAPNLGIVTIIENNVTIDVPPSTAGAAGQFPFTYNALGTGKGSIEASGISTFLVVLNAFAAGAVAGALKGGHPPFKVTYNMKQQFYINNCHIVVSADVDKVFDQFSAAISAGGFLGIDNISLSTAYQNCITSGAIKTKISINNAVLPDDSPLKKTIDTYCEDMRKTAMDMVKSQVFDWNPTADPPATADRGLFGSLFGGVSASLKSNYQKHGVHVDQTLDIDGTIAVYDTATGGLEDIEPAVRADIGKYLTFIDVGDVLQKVQVAGYTKINWGEKLPDGTDLRDPIASVQMEVGYPNFSQPTGAGGQPNPQFLGQGFHYVTGQKNPNRPAEIAVWTKDNPNDIINISFLKLQQPIPGWDVDEVVIRKTLVYDVDDPRVDISGNTAEYQTEVRTKGHAPTFQPDEVGYVYVKFFFPQMLRNDAVSITLNVQIGTYRTSLNISQANHKTALFEVFSDKHFNETSFSYDVQAVAVGPNLTDEPIMWGTPAPIQVPVNQGRIKYIDHQVVTLPAPPADKLAAINAYIKNFQADS
jgi:hypothetical protein